MSTKVYYLKILLVIIKKTLDTKNDRLNSDYRKLTESFKWFLENCLNYNSSKRWSFKNMDDIFKLNPIDAHYRLI